MNYKISIIIPIYNVEEYIGECLDSIANQTLGVENIEVIMVNDCSTDESGRIIEEYAAKYDSFKAINLEKNSKSPGKPRNKGIDSSNGDYLMFCDPDDYYVENACEVLYNKIIEEDADIVSSRFFYKYETHSHENKTPFGDLKEIRLNLDDDKRFFELGPNVWTKIYRSKFIKDNGIRFLENMWAEDLAFNIETILEAKACIHMNNYFSYYYRVRDGENKSFTFSQNKEKLLKTVQGYFKTVEIIKNHDKYDYFPLIFKGHLQYWTKLLILSDTSTEEKKEILKKVSPLFKRYCKVSSQLEDIYLPIFENISKNRYDQALLDVKSLKYFFNTLDYLKKRNDYLNTQISTSENEKRLIEKIEKNQAQISSLKGRIAELQTINGYLNYKTNNLIERLKKRMKG